MVVVVGILMVLIGLTLPAIGTIRSNAIKAQALATLRQNVELVQSFVVDHQSVYPIGHDKASTATMLWYRPLVEGGYLSDERAADPAGVDKHNTCRFALTAAVLHPAEFMTPGNTYPVEFAMSAEVRESQIVYPDQKGLMWQWVDIRDEVHHFWTYDPFDAPSLPVAACDLSATMRRCTDFVIDPPYFENWVGWPVDSTWGGYKGRDRLR